MTRHDLLLLASLLFATTATPVSSAPAQPERHATLPAASPDGRWIAYVREYGPDSCEFRVVGVDGTGDRPLAIPNHGGGAPGWVDRGRVASLVTSEDDTCTLWTIAVAGGEARVRARLTAKALCLSHDGRHVAYAVGTWTRGRLTVSDPDGRHPRALSDSSAAWFNIAWSPDDRTLAAARMDSTRNLQVWLVDVASGRARALTSFPPGHGRPQWPAWSPDGRRVAVQAGNYLRDDPANSTSDIWVIEVATGRATRITQRPRPWLDETPTWLADHHHLVIQSTRSGRFELWRIGDDGGEARQLTR